MSALMVRLGDTQPICSAARARADGIVLWTDLARGSLPGRIAFHQPGHFRARAYEAHLSLQDVDQLRQLIEAEAAQPAADARHARVVPVLVDEVAGVDLADDPRPG